MGQTHKSLSLNSVAAQTKPCPNAVLEDNIVIESKMKCKGRKIPEGNQMESAGKLICFL